MAARIIDEREKGRYYRMRVRDGSLLRTVLLMILNVDNGTLWHV